jgi:hypothetical protein
LGFRFFSRQGDNGDLRFILNHDQFQQHNMLLVAALKDCGVIK